MSGYTISAYFAQLVPFSGTATPAAFSAGSTVNAQWILITADPVSAQVDERLERACKRGPISKIEPSTGCGWVAFSVVMEWWYDFPKFGRHLGNIG